VKALDHCRHSGEIVDIRFLKPGNFALKSLFIMNITLLIACCIDECVQLAAGYKQSFNQTVATEIANSLRYFLRNALFVK